MKNWLRALVAGFLLSSVAIGAVTAADVTYTYDALGRLTGVDYGAAGGQETITYDAAGNRTSRIVSGANVAPLPVNDSITTDQNTLKSFDPRVNDSDPQGDPLTIVAKTNGAHGVVVIVGGTSLTYTPATNYRGADSFTYTVSDGAGHSATATVSVTVVAVNQAPNAADDSLVVAENNSKSFDPRANDSDSDGDALAISAKTDGAHGTVFIDGGVSLIYTPEAGYTGSDSFTYTISDGQGHTAIASVAVTVTNSAPVAVADAITTTQNVAKSFYPLVNDTDVDGDTLSVTAATDGSHGAVTISGGVSLTYTPTTGYNGADSFTYTISDGKGHAATASVSVTVSNGAPIAVADAITTDQNVASSFDPRSNDTDPDGDTLAITAKTNGAHGAVAIVAGTSLTYTPTTNYNGTDSFTYTISDGQGHTATATVVVTVTAVNQVPVAANDSINTAQNTAKSFDPRINDSDYENDPLTITAKTDGTHGTVAINSSTSLTYTPATNYNGADSFTYTISDGQGHTATATVSVTIANTAPTAVADSISTPQNTAKTFDPRSNDTDVDGDSLTITAKTDGAHGVVAIVGGNSLTYTPAPGYNGADSFTYTIADGQAHTATATVTVAVTNGAPVAVADAISTPQNTAKSFDPRVNDTDADGDALTITAKTDGVHGAVAIVGGTSLTYTPTAGYNGSDSFTYTISDGQGHATTATVAVTITNSAPVAVADAVTTGQNTAKTFDPRANDTDADGDALTISAKTNGAHGAVVINAGTSLTFTPTAGYSGADAFTYTISDGQGHTATATVSVTVSAVNQAPVAVNDIKTVKKNTTLTFDPRANDSDPDGDQISVISTSVAAHGSLSVFNNMISYVPTINYTGTDTFTYTISDGQSHTASATVSVSITSNGAPVAVNDSIAVPMNEYKGFAPTLNDSDPEGNTLSIVGTTNGAHGMVASGASPLVLIYTPATGYVGADSFTYTISDGNGNTATAVVSVAVGTPNNAPVAVNDSVVVVMNTTKNISPLTNDSDADGDRITISSISSAAHGTASIASSGTRVNYTPVNGYSGADSFTYTISDGGPHTATATVSVSVGANHMPTAVSDSVVLAQSASAITISPMDNDVDLDGDTLTITAVTNGTRGTVTKTASSVKYTRTVANVPGTDSFTYTISDRNGGIAVGTVSVTTNNTAPVAINDTIKLIVNTAVTFNARANDSDADGNALTITAKTNGLHGTVVIASAANLTYTPAANYNGTDSFTYTISDGWTQTATATVYVVTSNSAPVATNDSGSVPGNLTTNMPNLLSNDSDLDGDALTIVATTNGTHGTVALVSGSVVSYTPAANYYGEDSFTYTISDGHSHTATATVSGHVIARPIANNDNIVAGPKSWIKLSPKLVSNDTSPSGDALQIATMSDGAHGLRPTGLAGAKLDYYATNGTYVGADSFSYTLAGGALANANDSLPATVSVTISNGKFAAVDDYVSLPAGGSATFDPRANDINTLLDGDGETSEVFFNSTVYGPYSQDQGVAFTTPSHGSVTYHVVGLLAADGFVYKPTVGYSGPDSFQYTVLTQDADGNYYFATGTVYVNVQ